MLFSDTARTDEIISYHKKNGDTYFANIHRPFIVVLPTPRPGLKRLMQVLDDTTSTSIMTSNSK
jgi:hypothetical protein